MNGKNIVPILNGLAIIILAVKAMTLSSQVKELTISSNKLMRQNNDTLHPKIPTNRINNILCPKAYTSKVAIM